MAYNYKSQRKARERKTDAERQQRRRDDMAKTKKPETHAVDRAVSEALAHMITGFYKGGTPTGAVSISAAELFYITLSILAVEYDRQHATTAIWRRIGPRENWSRWTLGEPEPRERA